MYVFTIQLQSMLKSKSLKWTFIAVSYNIVEKMLNTFNVQKYGRILSAIATVSMFSIINSIQKYNKLITGDVLENTANNSKLILLWTTKHCKDCAPLDLFSYGNSIFKEQNCTYQNCYIVQTGMDISDINDPSEYDAIMFHGRPMMKLKPEELPQIRRPEQIYMFVQMESSTRYPVCQKYYDDFFNWTVTYRLDSDIPWPYFIVQNQLNETVGPGEDIEWEKEILPIDNELAEKIGGKTKLAAWFVSNCARNRSGRLKFANELSRYLSSIYNRTLDIYGECGPLKCPRKNQSCYDMLEKDYLFYLSMENSLAVDYVTEKLMTALQYYVIPVVYGVADYSRFLPPGSYLDARALGPEALAAAMMKLMLDRYLSYDYFRWRRHYRYLNNLSHARSCACAVCQRLNERSHIQKRYGKFREWWNGDRFKYQKC